MANRTDLLLLLLVAATSLLISCRGGTAGEGEHGASGSVRSDTSHDQQKVEALSPAESDSLEGIYLQKGAVVAGATFAALGGELRRAMATGGVEAAVPYCNLAALPITDSLADQFGCSIRRTAIRWRNPANEPDAAEAAQLQFYDSLFASGAGADARPQVRFAPNQARFFAPIPTLEFCLSCHGAVGADIAAADYSLIRRLYPDDGATDFKEGDLRGMWSIAFPLD